MQEKSVNWQNWVLLVFLALIWGGSFVLMKRGLTLFHYTEVAGIRLGLSAICLMPVLIVQRKTLQARFWLPAIAVTLFGSAIPAILFPLAQTQVSSALAGTLNSLTPLWVLVVGALFFSVPLTRIRVGGILIGLLGAMVLVLLRDGSAAQTANNNLYGLFIVFATFLYGISANIVGRFLNGIDALTATAIGIVSVGTPMLIYILFFTDVPNMIWVYPQNNINNMAVPPFFYLVALAIINTVIGSIGYIALIQRTNPVFASVVTYIIPVFSIVFGSLDGEYITYFQISGMLLILSGVYLVNKS